MQFGKPIVFNPGLKTHNVKIGEYINYPICYYQLVNDNRMVDFMEGNHVNLIHNYKILKKFKLVGIFEVDERNFNPNVARKFQGYMLNLLCVG
tara:strand:+ start:216 stop:494 length:279 start_codon:yes stop_codon:yes gene_type:complete